MASLEIIKLNCVLQLDCWLIERAVISRSGCDKTRGSEKAGLGFKLIPRFIRWSFVLEFRRLAAVYESGGVLGLPYHLMF